MIYILLMSIAIYLDKKFDTYAAFKFFTLLICLAIGATVFFGKQSQPGTEIYKSGIMKITDTRNTRGDIQTVIRTSDNEVHTYSEENLTVEYKDNLTKDILTKTSYKTTTKSKILFCHFKSTKTVAQL